MTSARGAGPATSRVRSCGAPSALTTFLTALCCLGAAWARPASIEAGEYYLSIRSKCLTQDFLKCLPCGASAWSAQVYTAPAPVGHAPQGWQLEHVGGGGSGDAFVLRPLDPRCCNNFVSSVAAGCAPAHALLDASDRSKHPAEIYWLAEAAPGGGLRFYLQARQGCELRFLGAPAPCGSSDERIVSLQREAQAAAWELLPLGSLRPPPPPPPSCPSPPPPRPKPKPPPRPRPKPPPRPRPKPPPSPKPPRPKPPPSPKPPLPKPPPRPRPKPPPSPKPPLPKPPPRPRPKPPPSPKPPLPKPPQPKPPTPKPPQPKPPSPNPPPPKPPSPPPSPKPPPNTKPRPPPSPKPPRPPPPSAHPPPPALYTPTPLAPATLPPRFSPPPCRPRLPARRRWHVLPPLTDGEEGGDVNNFVFTLCGSSSVPYAVYTSVNRSRPDAEHHQTEVKKYAAGRWLDVGRERFTDAHGSRMALACWADGTPLFALSDADRAFNSTVFRFQPPWAPMGGIGWFVSVFDISVAIDGQGRPMVAFTNAKRQYRAAVMRFANGGWAYAGADGDAISEAFADSVELLVGPPGGGPHVAGVPFLSYMDFGKNSADVERLEGTGRWESVGGEDAILNSQLPHIAFAPDGTLYLAHLLHGAITDRRMMVRQYNATLDEWFEIGARRPAPDGFVTALDIAVDARGVPCVAFTDGGDDYKVSVQCYKRSTNSWLYVGNEYFSPGGASYVSLDFDLKANKPWVGFWDSVTKATTLPSVMRYDAYSSTLYD